MCIFLHSKANCDRCGHLCEQHRSCVIHKHGKKPLCLAQRLLHSFMHPVSSGFVLEFCHVGSKTMITPKCSAMWYWKWSLRFRRHCLWHQSSAPEPLLWRARTRPTLTRVDSTCFSSGIVWGSVAIVFYLTSLILGMHKVEGTFWFESVD